jgi:hypothetical protein
MIRMSAIYLRKKLASNLTFWRGLPHIDVAVSSAGGLGSLVPALATTSIFHRAGGAVRVR